MFLKLINTIKKWFALFLDWLSPLRNKPKGLLAETEEARREWQLASNLINHADKEMIDFAIHHYNASERRFIGLLEKARKAGLKAWSLENENIKTGTAGEQTPGHNAINSS